MIKMTMPNNDPIFVDPTSIRRLLTVDVYTAVRFDAEDYIYVTESPETVVRLITEYKQRQMRLQAAYNARYEYEREWKFKDAESELARLESEDRGE
jgi:hypothetical protein